MKVFTVIVVVVLGGCASVEPDAVVATATHDSHLTQHRPFTDEPTNYGVESIGVDVAWRRGRLSFDVSEAYDVAGYDGCARCPRESFQATVGYALWRRG